MARGVQGIKRKNIGPPRLDFDKIKIIDYFVDVVGKILYYCR
jgi:hypothetical protein